MPDDNIRNYWDVELSRWQEHRIEEPARGQVLDAISYLRTELGEEFPSSAIIPNPELRLPWPTHPIINMLAYISDWNIKALTSLAEKLEEVKAHSTGYEKIISKLKNRERYLEGLSILNTAYRFSKAGFDTEIEPNVENKTPDLRLTDRENQTAILVEVTVLGRSRSAEQSVANSQRIIKYLQDNGQGINADINIHTLLSEEDLNEVITVGMPNAIAEVRRTSMAQSYNLNCKLDAALSPRADQIGNGVTINGPPYSTPEVGRLIGRIREKYEGLSGRYPKIIVIQANFLLLSDYAGVIQELEVAVNTFPELLFVVVINEYIAARQEEIREVLGVSRYIKRVDGSNHERDFILTNSRCQVEIPANTKGKLDASYN